MATQKFPSIKSVARTVAAANRMARTCRDASDPEWSMDVRLQVYSDGNWALHTGDSSYDLDHRGFWGSSSVDGRHTDCRAIARDLIDQCREAHAMAESDSGSEEFSESA